MNFQGDIYLPTSCLKLYIPTPLFKIYIPTPLLKIYIPTTLLKESLKLYNLGREICLVDTCIILIGRRAKLLSRISNPACDLCLSFLKRAFFTANNKRATCGRLGKHLEFRHKYSAARRRIFNSLVGVISQ